MAVTPCPTNYYIAEGGFFPTLNISAHDDFHGGFYLASDEPSFFGPEATYEVVDNPDGTSSPLSLSSTNKEDEFGNSSLDVSGKSLPVGVYTFTIKATLPNGCEYFQTYKLRVHPSIQAIDRLPGGKTKLSYTPEPSEKVVWERTPDLENPNWQPVSGIVTNPDGSESLTVDSSTGKGFYRLQLQ